MWQIRQRNHIHSKRIEIYVFELSRTGQPCMMSEDVHMMRSYMPGPDAAVAAQFEHSDWPLS